MPSTRYQKINAHHYRHIWVVGDIHGEYQLLQSRLHQLSFGNDSNLLIVFYVQIMPDDFVMQLHRF
ncbi:serine/threonine-specific protein phosphatase 2 [Escherichia coli]|nr:serine/threonine-specific protein phosphatase 2 [Escherichia coli]